MRYARMRELSRKKILTESEAAELNSAATIPPCALPDSPERDSYGRLVPYYPCGRQARRDFIRGLGQREQVARSRIQRKSRKRRAGGVQ